MKTATLLFACLFVSLAVLAEELQWAITDKPVHHILVVTSKSGGLMPQLRYTFGQYMKGFKAGDYITVIEADSSQALLRISQAVAVQSSAELKRLQELFDSIEYKSSAAKGYKTALELAFRQIRRIDNSGHFKPMLVLLTDGRFTSSELRSIADGLSNKRIPLLSIYVSCSDKSSGTLFRVAKENNIKCMDLHGGEWDALVQKERPRVLTPIDKPQPVARKKDN